MKTVYKRGLQFPKTSKKRRPKFNPDDFKSETRDSIVLPNRQANLLVNETKELRTVGLGKFRETANKLWLLDNGSLRY